MIITDNWRNQTILENLTPDQVGEKAKEAAADPNTRSVEILPQARLDQRRKRQQYRYRSVNANGRRSKR